MRIAYMPYMAMHKRGGCSSPPPFCSPPLPDHWCPSAMGPIAPITGLSRTPQREWRVGSKICWHSADLPYAGLEPKWRTQANVEPKGARIPLHPPSLPTVGHKVQAYTRSPLSAHLLIGEEASSSANVSCGTTSSPPAGMPWHSASSQLTCSCWQYQMVYCWGCCIAPQIICTSLCLGLMVYSL